MQTLIATLVTMSVGFQVWRDYTASIARACEERGYAYVFETDVADFFPSVDRDRARGALESRTGAPSSVTGLLFHCLESWLVRRSYEKGSGLPIDPHDISRLVAHNYLKAVDSQFPNSDGQQYLRFVDDTAIFVRDKDSCESSNEGALHEIGADWVGAEHSEDDHNADRSIRKTAACPDQSRYRRYGSELRGAEIFYARNPMVSETQDSVELVPCCKEAYTL